MPDVRLCIASPSFYPVVGGCHTRFRRYLPHFEKRDISVEVYSGTPKPKKLPSTDLMEDWINEEPGTKLPTVFLDDVPVRRVRTHHVGRRRADDMGRGLTDYFRSSDHRPNVLQWLSALRPEMIPWIRDLRKSGIGAVHAVTIAPREEESFFRRYTKTRRLKAAYRNFDCVIANATSGRDLLYDMGIRARIEVIPNGVDLDRFHPASGPQEISRIREALGIAPGRRWRGTPRFNWFWILRTFPD